MTPPNLKLKQSIKHMREMDYKESRRSTLAAPQRAGALESNAKKQKKRKKQKDTFSAVRDGYFMR